MFPYFQVPRVEKKVFGKDNKDNNHNSLHLTLKNCPDICPRALSVPRGSQDSSNFNLLSGNCSRVRGKNCDYFFAPNGSYRRREHTEDANICTTTSKKLLSWPSWRESLQSYLLSFLRLWVWFLKM